MAQKQQYVLRMQQIRSLREQDMHMLNSYLVSPTPLPRHLTVLLRRPAAYITNHARKSAPISADNMSKISSCCLCNPKFWFRSMRRSFRERTRSDRTAVYKLLLWLSLQILRSRTSQGLLGRPCDRIYCAHPEPNRPCLLITRPCLCLHAHILW